MAAMSKPFTAKQVARQHPASNTDVASAQSPQPDTAYITIFTSGSGPVVKRFSMVGDEVEATASARIHTGSVRSVRANDPEELTELLDGLGANQAVGLGILATVNQSFPLVTKDALRAGAVSRSGDFFSHNEGAGWGLIDIDTKDLPPSVSANLVGDDIVADIFRVVPELEKTAHVVRPSSSAGIIKPDGTVREATGTHVFFRLAHAPNLPQLLQAMHDRCWVAGLGYIKLSKAGYMLERSPVDLAVAGAERLIFEADPIVQPPLSRVRPPDRLKHGGSLSALVPPDPMLVAQLKQQARDELKPAAAKMAQQFEAEQVEKIRAETKVSKTEARRIFRQRMQGGELSDDDVLETSTGVFERVGDFLERVTWVHGLPCPVEGSSYGPSKAAFYPAGSHSPEPRIISYSHGVKTYFHFERYRHLRGLRWLPKH
jgi:hypothetical protein